MVAVEALPRGCRAAYGAGLRCAAIPSEVAPDLRFPSSAVRLPALPGADLPGLLRGLPPPSGEPPLAEEPCAPPPTGRPRAVIWDLDGTIAELLVDRAWAKVFADHGLEPPPDWGRYLDAEDPYQVRPLPWLRGQVGPELDPAAVQAALADHLYALRDGDPVRPGVRALLAALAQAGVRQAVATANRGDDLPQRLEEWGVAPFLDAVVTPWHVAYSKPAPDLFLHAAAALGVAPGEALAIEDSPMGALGAVRAGLHCLVVPNAVTRRLRFPAAARRIETLEGMDAATVLGAGG